MWRGQEVSQAMKDNDTFEYMTVRKLHPKIDEDKKLVNKYWIKLMKTKSRGKTCG